MTILYNIAIYILSAGISLAAIFSSKVRLMLRGRRETFARLAGLRKSERVVWVHCASLGEFEQGRSLIETIKANEPNTQIVLTFFSPSGYEVRRNFEGADIVCYMPSDSRRNARRFVRAVRPDVAIFVKYEYWYNFLKQLRLAGSQTIVVSAIFRPDMRFFKKNGGFFRKMLRLVSHYYVQNEESAQLLTSIGITDNVTVAGDTRFDRVVAIVDNAPKLPIIERFVANTRQSTPNTNSKNERLVMICGSTWPQDNELLVKLMHERPEVSFIIAPHTINDLGIEKLIQASGRVAIRYTEAKNSTNELDADRNKSFKSLDATLMIIDCIGILSSVYAYGDLAYIGGGFGAGIHNTLEPATWGLPVIFGPNYNKFAEAHELIALKGAFSIKDFETLYQALDIVVANHSPMSVLASEYVRSHAGATKLIYDDINKSKI